ncbi:MAG: hypothetical protein J5663_05435 [Bacteroidaceae bacterium]|nr:hypothetical protein [Bacteroidaceae bacterium]
MSDSIAAAQQALVSDTTVSAMQDAASDDAEVAEQGAVSDDDAESDDAAVSDETATVQEQDEQKAEEPAQKEVAQKKQKKQKAPKAPKQKASKSKSKMIVPEVVEEELVEVEVPSLKGTTMEQRIGHGMDSILIRRAYETFESYYAKGVNEEMPADSAFLYAYEPWMYVFKRAPYVNATLYKHGLWMWHTLAVEGKTPKVRNFYFKQLMDTYDKRIENLDAINSLYDEEGSNSRFVTTRGDVICEKAQNFLQYNPDSIVQMAWGAYQDNNYQADYNIPWTKEMENLYQMYKTAIGDLGRSTRGYTLAYFVKTYYYRYKANKADSTYATDFVNDYVLAKDLCDFFLDSAKQYVPSDQELTAEDSIRYQNELRIQQSIVDEYTYPQWYADYYFQMNPEAASPEFLNQFFMKKIEEEKNNPGYLAWVLKTLESIGQTEIDVYDKAADYLSAARPAGGGGGGSYSQDKIFFSQAVKNMKEMDFFTAKELMQQCVDACSDNAQKAKYLYQAGLVAFSKGRIADAREYANKSISFNKNYGDPYLLLADIIRRSAPTGGKGVTRDQLYWNLGIYCCAATDKALQAMRMDPGCKNKAQTKIANYARNYYPRSEAFFRGAKEGQRVSVDGLSTTLRLK